MTIANVEFRQRP